MQNNSDFLAKVVRATISAGLLWGASTGKAYASCGDAGRQDEKCLETVIVTAPPPPNFPGIPSLPGGGIGEGYPDGGEHGEGPGVGGGQGSDNEPDCKTYDPQRRQDHVRRLAAQTSREILEKPDSRRREYLSFHYRSDLGPVVSGPLFRGGNDSAEATEPAPGVRWTRVVAFTHNHPAEHPDYCQDATSAQINAAPSEGDWRVADQIVGNGASPDLLTLYVIGCDRILREYPYADREHFKPYRVSGQLRVREGEKIPGDTPAPTCE